MPTFTWNGTPGSTAVWNTPSDWIGGVVPNASDAAAILPVITTTSNGAQAYYAVMIPAAETVTLESLSLGAYLELDGVLNILGALTYNQGEVDLDGGTLSVGTLDDANGYDIQGSGTIVSAGSIVNHGRIIGENLTLSFAAFDNAGTLLGPATLDVTGGPAAFVNLVGTTLEGGTFGGALTLVNVGPIVTDAATITSAAILVEVAGSTSLEPLQSTLATIAAGGVLSLGTATDYVTSNTLTVDGAIELSGGSLTAADIVLSASGTITGFGVVSSPITGTGRIIATGGTLAIDAAASGQFNILSGTLAAAGAMAGSITFAGTESYGGGFPGSVPLSDSLILDDPTAFTATIVSFNNLIYGVGGLRPGLNLDTSPESITLEGISLANIMGETYIGGPQDGTLSLNLGTSTIDLDFAGHYQLSDFVVSAGPQPYSNSPPSVRITEQTFYLTGTAPTIDAATDQTGRTIYGTQSNASITLDNGNETITLLGSHEAFSTVASPGSKGLQNADDVVLGMQGNSTVTLSNGYQVVVAFGSGNTISIGNAGGTPGLLGALSYINAGTGDETVTAGTGTNVINTGGYGDTITVGNGLNLIFATSLSAGGTADPVLGPAGHTTLTLGTGNNFAYLHGTDNVIEEGGGTDAIWGGTGGDRFVLSPAGGALFVENFGNGDVLDLSKILAGVPLAADLSNIANFVNVVGTGPDDDVFGVSDGGTKTVLQVVGTSGTAYVNLENVGSLGVAGLLAENALVFPTS